MKFTDNRSKSNDHKENGKVIDENKFVSFTKSLTFYKLYFDAVGPEIIRFNNHISSIDILFLF